VDRFVQFLAKPSVPIKAAIFTPSLCDIFSCEHHASLFGNFDVGIRCCFRPADNLGDSYENGSGIPKDYSLALYWYLKAAESGLPTAFISLGSLAEQGKGVDKDLVRAYAFYYVAPEVAGGSNKSFATQERDDLVKGLTESELEEAKKLIEKIRNRELR
jgi:hypothetical protein